MKIRLMDTPDQVEAFATVLRRAFEVVEESGEYANRGTSRMLRKYMDLRLRAESSGEADGALRSALLPIAAAATGWTGAGSRWRVVITDSESADGIMPVCDSPEHPEDDRDQQWGVYDCCDTGVIETHCERLAPFLVAALNAAPALLAAAKGQGEGADR